MKPDVPSSTISVGHEGLEPSTNGLRDEEEIAQSESSRDVAQREGVEGADGDPACFTVRQDDSSGIVNEIRAERIDGTCKRDRDQSIGPTDVEIAIRAAIKVAVDAGDYDRATALLDVVMCLTPKVRA